MNSLYTLLPLHRAFHVAPAWPNSKYEDNNEILYHPSKYQGMGQSKFGGEGSSEEGSGGGLRGNPSLCGGNATCASPNFLCQCNSGYFIPNGSNTDYRGVDSKTSDTTSIVSLIFFSCICCTQSENLHNLKIALHILSHI